MSKSAWQTGRPFEEILDEIVEDFETALYQGREPNIDDYVPDDERRYTALLELVYAELDYRLRKGWKARVEEYLERYPELSKNEDEVVGLIAQEFKIRRCSEPDITVSAFVERFPAFRLGLTPVLAELSPDDAIKYDHRFRKKRRHAAGGLGLVFVAHDEELNRDVALKELREQYKNEPEYRARFLREATITAALEHPGTVPTYGRGESEDGLPRYAMRFVRGDTLDHWIQDFHRSGGRRGRFVQRRGEIQKLLRRFIVVCNAVHYAHSKEIIHCDLKPENIMLGKYDETLVVDWGLAKLTGPLATELDPETIDTPILPTQSHTQVGRVIGTLQFMSPEQASGQNDQIGRATDVYGLGATLYTILTGRPPHLGRPDKRTRTDDIRQADHTTVDSESILNRRETTQEVVPDDTTQQLERIRQGKFPSPRSIKSDLPAPLESICLRAMALKPEDRYQSPSELAVDIDHWLDDEPVMAHHERLFERLGRWTRRHRSCVRAATVAILIVTAVSADAWYRNKKLAGNLEEALTAKGKALAAKEKALEEKEELHKAAVSEKERAELEKSLAQQRLYALQIAQAKTAFDEGNPGDCEQILGSCQLSLRGWEYDYLVAALNRRYRKLQGHHDPVRTVLYSPQDGRIISGSENGDVLVWNETTSQRLVHVDAGGLLCVAVSANGKRIATACFEDAVRVWNGETAKHLFSLERRSFGSHCVAFSPDDRFLVSGDRDKTLRVWDASDGSFIRSLDGHADVVRSVAFGTKPNQLVTGSLDGTVKVWDMNTWEVQRTLRGHGDGVTGVAVSATGDWIVSSSFDASLRMWDARTGELVRMLNGHRGLVWDVAMSHDGKWIVSAGSDGTIRVWDTVSGRPIDALKGLTNESRCVTVAPDGKHVASCGSDGTILLWNVAGNPAPSIFKLGSEEKVLAFSPTLDRIAAASDDRTIRVWNAMTGELIGTSQPRKDQPTENEAYGRMLSEMVFDSSGEQIAIGSYGGTVEIWDTTTCRLLHTLPAHDGQVADITFSRDDKRIATGGHDGLVAVFDTSDGRLLHSLRGHTEEVTVVEFSPDGTRIASGSWDGIVKIWDAGTGQELHTLMRRHASWISTIVFSRGGLRFITLSGEHELDWATDKTIRLWDVKSGDLVHELKGHTTSVCSATFNSDGTRIVSASRDGTVKVWNANSGAHIRTLLAHSEGRCHAEFSPNRGNVRLVSSSSADETVKVWDAEGRVCLFELSGISGEVTFDATGKEIQSWNVDSDGNLRVQRWKATPRSAPFVISEAHTFHVGAAIFSGDGRQIVSGGGDCVVKVWDAESGELVHTLVGHSNSVTSIAISDDGERIISGDDHGHVKVWDASTGELRRTLDDVPQLGGSVQSVAIVKEDDPLVLFSNELGAAGIWNVTTGKLVSILQQDESYFGAAAHSPDGKTLVTVNCEKYLQGVGTASLWEMETGKRLLSFGEDRKDLCAVAFSPDGKQIVSGGLGGAVCLWNVATGEQTRVIGEHGTTVNCVAFSPGGDTIASGSGDGTVRLWNAATSELLHTVVADAGSNSIDFDRNGQTIVVAHTDGCLRVWNVGDHVSRDSSTESGK